jgi:hypothetical protein
MSAKRILLLLAGLGLLAGCGSDPSTNAASSKGRSFEEAIGIDQASMNAREAKVQEAIRTCMKAEGFDYIPVDPSQSGMKIRFGGPDVGTDAKSRRTMGYGITTGLLAKPRSSQGSDPNEAIRNGLSDADRKAYDTALQGADAAAAMEAGTGGGRRVTRQVGSSAEAGPPKDQGCFGKAQAEVPGGPETVGKDLKDMLSRVEADPRTVAANRKWAECMAHAGYTDFEQPRDASRSVMDKMDALMGATPQGDGVTRFAIGGDDIDQAKLADLRQEEITIAVADGKCQDDTGYRKVVDKVQHEAEQRFLDDHPDLTSGS